MPVATVAKSGREGALVPIGRGHLPGLDGLRGLAVLLVVVYHFTSNDTRKFIEAHSFHGVLSQLPNVGWCGVDLFFVLSGFLITGILLDAKGSRGYYRKFWMRRVLRIFPLYYGVLAAIFIVLPLLHPLSPVVRGHLGEQIWLWAYGVNVYTSMPSHPLLDEFHLQHFWSLAVEEQFYLVWPFVIAYSQPKTAQRICAACVAVAFLFRLGLLAMHSDPRTIYSLTPCRLDGLAMGGWCALAIRNSQKIGDLFTAARVVAIVSALGLVAILFWRRTWSWDDPAMETLGISLLSLLTAGVLLRSLDPVENNPVSWILSCPILVTFGFYSYALYVFHFPLMFEFEKLVSVQTLSTSLHSQALSVVVYVVCATLLSLLVAALSWHIYEKRFVKLKRYFESTRSDDGAQTAGIVATPRQRANKPDWRPRGLALWIHRCPYFT